MLQVQLGNLQNLGIDIAKDMSKVVSFFTSTEIRVYFIPFIDRSSERKRAVLKDTKFWDMITEIFKKHRLEDIKTAFSNTWTKSSSRQRNKIVEN